MRPKERVVHLPKRTLPRVERDEVIEVHDDENAHLWAVSYSDFLMALLSFFILFYSVDEVKRDQLILNLTAELSHGGLSAPGQAENASTGTPASSTDAKATATRLPAAFFAALKGLDVKVEDVNQSLVVNFPDRFYRNGSYQLRDKKMLTRFLEIAKPYEKSFNIYFEGHTDSRPLVRYRTAIITDNYVLSSLRATTALAAARDYGFNEKYLFTQASSSNVRNSRSLSIRLERRKETL